jgi:hypothetical protein
LRFAVRDWNEPGGDDIVASLSPGHLGLSLSDGKTIWAALQQAIAERQVACLTASGTYCPHCGLVMRVKDYRRRRIATVYGRIDVQIPRQFCVACESKPTALTLPVTERSTAEYDRLRAKLAAPMAMTVALDTGYVWATPCHRQSAVGSLRS